MSDLFEEPFSDDGLWGSYARYATGITLSAGDSLTWNFVTTLNRLALDVFPFSRTGVHGIRPAFYQGGSQFTFGDCTVTAA